MQFTYRKCKIGLNAERYLFDFTLETFFTLLKNNQKFRDTIIDIFKQSKFEYVYMQFPVYSATAKNNQAYFELVGTGRFQKANPSSFMEQFIGKFRGEIVQFKNLSNDTDLISIVPTNNNNINASCSDIMSFLRYAPNELAMNLLTTIGKKMLEQTDRCYLSTHGKGVPWIHIRICNQPKYYVCTFS